MNQMEPLSDEEIAELGDFLLSDLTPEECMDISMLDGFLTGVVIGPDVVLPSEWLTVVWGDEEGPRFESSEQAQRIMELMMRHLNGIAMTFQYAPESFEPLFYERVVEDRTYTIVDEWCEGFLKSVDLRPRLWRELVEEEGADWLAPMHMFGSDAGQETLEESPDPEQAHAHWVARIVPALVEIHAFWLERREQFTVPGGDQAPYVKRPRVGRNQPCPCGSGKKFKKCCGSADRSLH